MAEVEENPSKRRKLYLLEDHKNSAEESPPLDFEDKNGKAHPNGQKSPEIEGNDLSKIDVQEPIKEDPPLSKSQLKKRRRKAEWEAAKDLRKDKRRDKRHEKQARKAQERADLQEKISRGEIEAPKISPEELKRRTTRPVLVPVTLIMDCDFNELMTEKELISLGAQLTRCYSDNRHSKHRAHVVVSSWNGALRTRFETVLTNHHKSWKGVRFMEKDFVGAAEDMDAVMRSRDGGRLVGAFASPGEDKIVVETNRNGPQNENGSRTLPEDSPYPSGAEPFLEESKEVDPVQESTKSSDLVLEELKEDISAEQPSSAPKPALDLNVVSNHLNSSSQPTASTQEARSEPLIASTNTKPPPISEPSIVYLTSDSPHTLDRLSPYTSYIIGGIVDKNRHKGLCYKRACERCIPTAKLPIGEYMTMQSRSVLAVNHVVEIMLKWLETGDWGEAFLSVIPKRKEAKLREKEPGQENRLEDKSEDEEDERGELIEEDDGVA